MNQCAEATGLIYKATNLVNGKCYIGQTVKSLRHRRAKHFVLARREDSNTAYFLNALKKYGECGFRWAILAGNIPREHLALEEMLAIYVHDAHGPNGYNSTDGGEGCIGYRHTPEVRKRLSQLATGRVPSKETRAKYSAALMGNTHTRGKHQTPETCERIAAAFRGRPKSDEHNRKNSAAHKGKKFSVEHRRNLSLAMRGRKHTEEWRRKHSEQMTGARNPMYGRKRPDTAERNRQAVRRAAA